MAVAKTIEIISSSTETIEAAIRGGIAKASETVKGIEGVWVKDTKAVVSNAKVTEWRVTLAVTFIVS
jgi:flavin-binding protein dodecin